MDGCRKCHITVLSGRGEESWAPTTNTPHAMAPTNRMCLQQEEGQESQPEVEEEEEKEKEDTAVPSPMLVCPMVSCPI